MPTYTPQTDTDENLAARGLKKGDVALLHEEDPTKTFSPDALLHLLNTNVAYSMMLHATAKNDPVLAKKLEERGIDVDKSENHHALFIENSIKNMGFYYAYQNIQEEKEDNENLLISEMIHAPEKPKSRFHKHKPGHEHAHTSSTAQTHTGAEKLVSPSVTQEPAKTTAISTPKAVTPTIPKP